MTDEHIEKTKSAIESAENIPADRKTELLDLLSKLKPAIAKVSETHHEDARSIARLVEASAREIIRTEKKPEQHNRLLHELKTLCKTLKRPIRTWPLLSINTVRCCPLWVFDQRDAESVRGTTGRNRMSKG